MSKLHRLPRRRASSLDVLFSGRSSSSPLQHEVSIHNLEDATPPPTPQLSPVLRLGRSESEGGGGKSSSLVKERVSALLHLSSMPSLGTSSLSSPQLQQQQQQQQHPLTPTFESGGTHKRSRSFSSSPKRLRKWAVNSWDGSASISKKYSQDITTTTTTTPATERMSQRSSSWDGASFGQYREKLRREIADLDSSWNTTTMDDNGDYYDRPPPPPLSTPPVGPPPPGMTGSGTFEWLSGGAAAGLDDNDVKPAAAVSFERSSSSPRKKSPSKNNQLEIYSSDGLIVGNNNDSSRVTFRREHSFIDEEYDDDNEDVIYDMDRFGRIINIMERGDSSRRRVQRQQYNDRSVSPSPAPERKSQQEGGGGSISGGNRNRASWWCVTWLWCDFCPIPPPKKPSWTRISSFVVRHAPCFWWCVSPLETSATDRAVLYRLNILCAVFAAVQAAVGVFLAIVLVAYPTDGNSADGLRSPFSIWDLNTGLLLLACVSAILFVITVYSLRFIRQVNILGAVRYMWALYWMLPIHIFLVIGLFDVHRVTNVWVKHWWRGSSMEWFRTLFCASGTAHDECMVPINGGDGYSSEEDWCLSNYNLTDCEEIRNAAETDTNTWCYIFYTANGIWGVLLVVLLLLTLDVLQGIITPPIVQASKEANIPAWLTLPIAGCFAIGCVFLFSPASLGGAEDSIEGLNWIGTAYMVAAGTFTISAFLGWFLSAFSVTNIQDKRRKKVAVTLFILTLILTILSVGAIFAASLIYALDVTHISLDDDQRGSMACSFDSGVSCTNCDGSTQRCPEWTDDDVVNVVQTELKLSATLAAIFFIYGFSALRFGFLLRSHIVKYQIDYV